MLDRPGQASVKGSDRVRRTLATSFDRNERGGAVRAGGTEEHGGTAGTVRADGGAGALRQGAGVGASASEEESVSDPVARTSTAPGGRDMREVAMFLSRVRAGIVFVLLDLSLIHI